MPAPPPPPPPPPPPGFGGGPPPPPAPPGGAPGSNNLPAKPPPTVAKDRGALLTDITKGTRLKKAVTNDRSAPQVERPSGASAGPPIGGAPAIPGLGKPSSGLAPPISSTGGASRARSNSDTGGASGGDTGGAATAPQLGGIFAGVGIPKLKRTGGGVDTGAERNDSYASDSETTRKPAPKPPTFSALKPPTVSKLNSLRPSPQTAESSPPQPVVVENSLVANLRKAPPKPAQRATSELPPRAPPPLPGAPKPPPPPISSRKPSTAAPPLLPSAAPSLPVAPARLSSNLRPVVKPPSPPSAPPPPPASAPRPPPSISTPLAAPPLPPSSTPQLPPSLSTPPAAPPPPPSSAPRPPPARSTPPPPPPAPPSSHAAYSDGIGQSVAMHAARNAFGNRPSSPSAPPPPLVPGSSPLKHSTHATTPPPAPSLPPPSKSASHNPTRSALDSSSYTLANGINSNHTVSPLRDNGSPSHSGHLKIEDSRWRFQPDSELPKPRDFIGGPKKYRAGRGSSVPLDLSQFR